MCVRRVPQVLPNEAKVRIVKVNSTTVALVRSVRNGRRRIVEMPMLTAAIIVESRETSVECTDVAMPCIFFISDWSLRTMMKITSELEQDDREGQEDDDRRGRDLEGRIDDEQHREGCQEEHAEPADLAVNVRRADQQPLQREGERDGQEQQKDDRRHQVVEHAHQRDIDAAIEGAGGLDVADVMFGRGGGDLAGGRRRCRGAGRARRRRLSPARARSWRTPAPCRESPGPIR